MRKKLLTIAVVFLVLLLSVGGKVFAEEGEQNVEKINNKKINKDAENLNVQIIADTNIKHNTISKKGKNSFIVEFDIVNEWNKTQPGVKYALELYTLDKEGRYLVDKVIGKDVDSLISGESIHKVVQYNIPQSLPVGQYNLNIVLSSKKGLLLSIANAGIIEKSEQTGVYINPKTCYLKIGDKKFALMQGVDVAQREQLELVCEKVTNFNAQSIKIPVYITTNKRTFFGGQVSRMKVAEENFVANETKQVVYVVRKENKPQAYEAKLLFENNETEISNAIFFRYIVQGDSATIQNVSTDKSYYKKDDIAQVSFMVSGMASAYPGARDKNMVKYLINANNLLLSVQIIDVNNQVCSAKQSKEFEGMGEAIRLSMPITKNCQDPTVIAEIKNKKGVVLDKTNFTINTDEQKFTSSKGLVEKKDNLKNIISMSIIGLLFVMFALYIFRKKNNGNNINIKTLWFLLIFGGCLFLVNFNTVEATSFATGKYHCFTLNGVKGYCTVNGTYDVTGDETCNDTIATASMQWSACSNQTIDAELYINGDGVWSDQSEDDDYDKTIWLDYNSGMQTKNLGKLSVGNHTIPFKIIFDHDWHDWNFEDSGTETITASKTINVKACPTCTGNLSDGSKKCPDANTGLTKDIAWHKSTDDCNADTKCAYTKKAECGPANGNSYETKSALENAGLCSNGFIMTNFNDTSGVPGGGWDWKCEKAGYDTNSCSAKKTGECKPAPNNVTLNNACSNGKLNSIYFDFDETKFTWACGTLENGQPSNPTSHLLYNGSISGYKFQNQPVSDTIEKHSTGGNQDCTCTPAYVYTCPVTISADCSSKCEQWAEEEHKPFKKDNNCFTNVSGDFINEVEYETATGKKCLNQQIKCPPCGAMNGGSDTVIEGN